MCCHTFVTENLTTISFSSYLDPLRLPPSPRRTLFFIQRSNTGTKMLSCPSDPTVYDDSGLFGSSSSEEDFEIERFHLPDFRSDIESESLSSDTDDEDTMECFLGRSEGSVSPLDLTFPPRKRKIIDLTGSSPTSSPSSSPSPVSSPSPSPPPSPMSTKRVRVVSPVTTRHSPSPPVPVCQLQSIKVRGPTFRDLRYVDEVEKFFNY